jgi:ectoine hydroxylase-related dioxygenase (phytanoyl-CoA dioxygenase family)
MKKATYTVMADITGTNRRKEIATYPTKHEAVTEMSAAAERGEIGLVVRRNNADGSHDLV